MSQNIFKIYDGRTNFLQWDTGQKLIVLDDSITEVHFSNRDMNHSIQRNIYELGGQRVCNVPDIILQLPRNLVAYAYTKDDNSSRTVKSVKFAVVKRPIPDGYVVDQGEQIDDINRKLEILENTLKDIELGKPTTGDYATKAEAQGYANAKDSAIAAAKKAGDDAQADVDVLEAKVGTVTEGKTVVEMISDAQTAATYDDTALKGRVTTVEGKVSTLIGTAKGDDTKSARTIAAEEVAKIVAGADTSYDTLKEIADWITSHKTDATAMNSAITTLEGKTSTLETNVGTNTTDIATLKGSGAGSVAKTVADAIAALDSSVAATAATGNQYSVLTGVTETDGKLTAKTEVKLAAIAKTGNVNDIIQTDGDVLIFDCGTSVV